jgi:hypothetical protein
MAGGFELSLIREGRQAYGRLDYDRSTGRHMDKRVLYYWGVGNLRQIREDIVLIEKV